MLPLPIGDLLPGVDRTGEANRHFRQLTTARNFRTQMTPPAFGKFLADNKIRTS